MYYLASEVRMHLDHDGNVRAKHAAAAYDAWKPFVDAFGSIRIVARLDHSNRLDDGPLVEGPGVTVHPLPYYVGLWQAPLGLLRIRIALQKLGGGSDVFVGRVPESVSLAVLARARRLRAKHAVILVADPRIIGQLLPQGLRTIAMKAFVAMATRAIANADAVIYVSQQYFQKLYPAPHAVPILGRSNVILPEDWFAAGPRQLLVTGGRLRLVTVGSLSQPAKGWDFLLSAANELSSRGRPVALTVVGSGRMESAMRIEATRLGLDVRFTGQVHDRLRLQQLLDESDIYISGSRSEGLPRATIEAMARALPVVSTDAGAASEVVSPHLLVPVDDAQSFADAVEFLFDNPSSYLEESVRSLERARAVAILAAPDRLSRFLQDNLLSSDLHG